MMKIIVLLLLLVNFFPIIACNQEILSKFKQNGYKVKDKRSEVIRFNKNIFHNFDMKTFKYNRTTPAFNATLYFKVNVEDKVEIVVQAYKLLSNEYRYFPLRFQLNFQKVYASNVIGLQNTKMCGNLTSFIFHKDVVYYICNFVPDDRHLPPLIPNGIYKIEICMLFLNQEIGLFNLFGEVSIPEVYRKT